METPKFLMAASLGVLRGLWTFRVTISLRHLTPTTAS